MPQIKPFILQHENMQTGVIGPRLLENNLVIEKPISLLKIKKIKHYVFCV